MITFFSVILSGCIILTLSIYCAILRDVRFNLLSSGCCALVGIFIICQTTIIYFITNEKLNGQAVMSLVVIGMCGVAEVFQGINTVTSCLHYADVVEDLEGSRLPTSTSVTHSCHSHDLANDCVLHQDLGNQRKSLLIKSRP